LNETKFFKILWYDIAMAKVIRVILYMILYQLSLDFSGSVSFGGELIFKRSQPTMIEVKVGKNLHWDYDNKIARQKAEAIYNYIHQKYNAEKSYAAIYSCPGRADLFVTVSSLINTQENYGKRFFLIKEGEQGFSLLSKTGGMMDSYILEPTFFTANNRIIILADTGAEYSWGVVAFEILNDKLKDLGTINVAKPTEEDTTNPIPDAQLKLSSGKLTVEFHTDLVFDPGGYNDRLVKRVNYQPINFAYNGKKFLLIK
jgi:hypothetical protein